MNAAIDNYKSCSKQRKIGVVDFSFNYPHFVGSGQNHQIYPRCYNHMKSNKPSSTQFCSTNNSSSSHLNILALNCQSVREKAFLLHERLIDDNIDIAILTETWLKTEGDEAFITSLTGSDYKLFSFPRPTGKGYGGVGFMIKKELIPFVKCKRLDYLSMEAAELKAAFHPCVNVYI